MSCWALSIDWNAVGAMLSGLGAIALAVLGWLGIGAWKLQYLGSRNIALRDEILTQAYEIEEICRYMLGPFSSSDEHAKLERKPDETDEEFERRAAYSVVQLRYNEHLEPFSRMRTLAFKAKAMFGEETFAAVGEIITLPRRFILLGQQVYRAEERLRRYEQGQELGLDYPEARLQAARDAYERLHSRFWGLEDGEEPIKEVESCVKQLEKLLADTSKPPRGWWLPWR